ncbi:MAG: alkaline phosphatase family protein [Candidatus Eisenbacteria bacterium]|nr:alkaline phosphatase family protein [Candidatus Eisenbacteria bacterium]
MKRILSALPLLLALAGCSGRETPLPERIVLLGVDAADPRILEALRSRGELPHFDRLMREGVVMDLAVDPPLFSPRVWTTLLTGFHSDHHGVESFTLPVGEEGKRIPVTSNLVRRRRVWDIFGEAGIDVGVVGHWVTWPAEPVNGFLLSNYTWPPAHGFEKEWEPDASWDSIGARTWPEGLEETVGDAVGEERYFREADFRGADRLDPALRHFLRKDLAFANAGFALWEERRPRFFTLYLESTDFFPHRLWMFHRYYEATRHGGSMEGLPVPDPTPPDRMTETLGPMVGETYRLADRVLGAVLERVDLSRDVVVVVSDHGFRTYGEGTEVHVGDERWMEIPFWHGETGLLIAAGPPFRRGARGGAVRPEDLTPLLLAAAGLPVGRDMDGRVPEEALDRRFLRDHPVLRVATYEKDEGMGSEERPIESPFDDEVRDKLRALGYID